MDLCTILFTCTHRHCRGLWHFQFKIDEIKRKRIPRFGRLLINVSTFISWSFRFVSFRKLQVNFMNNIFPLIILWPLLLRRLVRVIYTEHTHSAAARPRARENRDFFRIYLWNIFFFSSLVGWTTLIECTTAQLIKICWHTDKNVHTHEHTWTHTVVVDDAILMRTYALHTPYWTVCVDGSRGSQFLCVCESESAGFTLHTSCLFSFIYLCCWLLTDWLLTADCYIATINYHVFRRSDKKSSQEFILYHNISGPGWHMHAHSHTITRLATHTQCEMRRQLFGDDVAVSLSRLRRFSDTSLYLNVWLAFCWIFINLILATIMHLNSLIIIHEKCWLM